MTKILTLMTMLCSVVSYSLAIPEEPNMDVLGKRVGELSVDEEAINSGLKLLIEKALLDDLPKEARREGGE